MCWYDGGGAERICLNVLLLEITSIDYVLKLWGERVSTPGALSSSSHTHPPSPLPPFLRALLIYHHPCPSYHLTTHTHTHTHTHYIQAIAIILFVVTMRSGQTIDGEVFS